MGLRFVLGRARTDKSNYIVTDIKEQLKKEPVGRAIIYIVPEQMTFQQEYSLFRDEEIRGSIRAQVFSFSRLAWRVLTEVGGGARQFISSTGTQMMLRKIIEQQEGTFNVFQRAVEKRGFIEELEGVITELKRHCVTPELLEEQLSFIEHEPLTNKLSDIHYIYDKLSQLMKDNYIDGEDQLQLLADKIPETAFLRDADIYIDGFHRFTPIELQIIEQLLETCRNVTISLTTDQHEAKNYSEFDLFYQTTETYHRLKGLAMEAGTDIHEPIVLKRENDEAHFSHLEKNFDIRPARQMNALGTLPIELAEAVHPRAEVEAVAQQIIKLIREDNYRFNDMVIYIREADPYEDLIKTIFKDFKIPVFVDEKRMMINHPLIEFIRSLLEMVETNWRYDALFRVLKTGFIKPTNEEYPLTDDAIDKLENYVLEFGIRHKSKWVEDDKWIYERFRGFSQAVQRDEEVELEKAINAYRQQVVDALLSFDEALRKAKTNRERCEVIYLLLEKLNVPNHLDYLRNKYDEEGQIEEAREHEQVWDGLIQLLDECVELIGDEKMSLALFKDVLEAGFDSLQFAHVPPTLDHVIVGTIDHSRIANKKCSFLLGVNEGVWPMTPPIDGIINEDERDILKKYGLELAESNRRNLLDDLFYIYLAFTSAEDYLWVSYPISNGEGDGKEASQMIRRIQDLFPQLHKPITLQDPDELYDSERFITTKEETRAALSLQFSRYLRGYDIKDVWWQVLNWYINEEDKHGLTYKVMQSLFYENIPVSLSEATVKKMYSKEIRGSVSRLETFYRCSYQHFAQYNLQLEERRTYQLAAPDIGQLFHEALKVITEWISDEGKHFQDLTKEDSTKYARRSVTKLAPVLQHRILSSSKRYGYIQRKLQDVIARATYILSEQARLSGFSPVGIELGFGFDDEELKPVVIDLPNNYKLMLRGRIDRVDKADINGDLYLRIIDYKSSEHDLRLLDVYYGLALQMLTYLNVILTQSEAWLGQQASPAGVLYFHMHNKQLNLEEYISDSDIFDRLFKEHKMNGLLIEETDVVRLMDTSLESGYSQIVPAAITAKDSFYKNAKVAGHSVFEQLQSYILSLIEDAGIKMVSGDISLNPFEHKKRKACTFCSFKAVCQFDPVLPENNFRQLTDMKDEDILALIEKNESEEE